MLSIHISLIKYLALSKIDASVIELGEMNMAPIAYIKSIFVTMISMVALLACSPNTTQVQKQLKDTLQTSLDQFSEQYHVPGAVLLVKTPDFHTELTSR